MAAVMAVFGLLMVMIVMMAEAASDTNSVYQPCQDSKVQRSDGFTLGIAISSRISFFHNRNFSDQQLSPCDSRLQLSSSNSKVVVFRPKVDEISLLTINSTATIFSESGGYMVAFAGRKQAARSYPTFIGNRTYTVTSFTLVLEFDKGVLQNLYWKRSGCSACSGKNSEFVCINNSECSIKSNSCKGSGGNVDCSLGIQLAFSGTDKHLSVFNSWYEVSRLQQYSLYGLYSNLRNSLTDKFNNFF